jgi:hypothetical protein
MLYQSPCDGRPASVPKSAQPLYPRFYSTTTAWLLGWAHAFFNRMDSFIMSMPTRKKTKGQSGDSKHTRHYYMRTLG